MKLTATEEAALEILKHEGGCLLSSKIPNRNERGVFGEIIPGMGAFRSLEKKGLIFFTEEEPIILDDGTEIDLTPLVYLVEKN